VVFSPSRSASRRSESASGEACGERPEAVDSGLTRERTFVYG
jgi:hypothetical protein